MLQLGTELVSSTVLKSLISLKFIRVKLSIFIDAKEFKLFLSLSFIS
jgi:hypothetical protein